MIAMTTNNSINVNARTIFIRPNLLKNQITRTARRQNIFLRKILAAVFSSAIFCTHDSARSF
jgi:hypothetical protein